MFLLSLLKTYKTYRDVKGVHDNTEEGLSDISFDIVRPVFAIVSLILLGLIIVFVVLFAILDSTTLEIVCFILIGLLALVRLITEIVRSIMTRITKSIVRDGKKLIQ
ncbi:hypothetical protein A2997_01560 [Candidatus Nomurabacteria bacterium RIFCSPLOWO2_01_FULL_36_10b]|uniref:Uncharacterized protein n=1 Tax=Candidatus Nomurabacteria bacterium RIFCSPLOWO2_01_FULL_36_10b TaxID=1801766 RepID=A0A1F6WNA4_9BACT|nr:MAG: hypothetical protein A2997_01560 [Candidatus Nomurabacteria bacterium RIFCSPLOWO2_01_FULL_36_10b]